MGGNILNIGVEGLKELKMKLIQLDRFQNDNSILVSDESKLEKYIKNKEDMVEEELTLTIKKRKEEIEATYNQEVSKLKDDIKKVQNKKEKSKNAQISERIKLETSDLSDDYEQMNLEIKKRLKEEKMPTLINTNIFYSLYMPRGTKEFSIVIIALLVVLLLIPCGIYFLILPEQKVSYLIAIYVATVVIFGAIYLVLGSKIKDKYLYGIKEIREIRTKMTKNKGKRKKIRKRILKDKDESIYSLEHYDEKVNNIDQEIEAVESRKSNAIISFDQETKPVITEEIRGHYSEELLNMNSNLHELKQKVNENNENIKHLSRELVEDYEAYLGKEIMSVEKLDRLINIMEENNLQKVSEGISVYKKSNQ